MKSGGYSLVAVHRFHIAVASLVPRQSLYGSQASVVVARGLSNCGSWALELRFSSCGHRLSVSRHVGSFWTKDQTHVSFKARQILNNWTTREACLLLFNDQELPCISAYFIPLFNSHSDVPSCTHCLRSGVLKSKLWDRGLPEGILLEYLQEQL